VLNDISLTIDSGEIFFVLGGSGTGKSVLLSIIAGLSDPTSGKVLINDTDVHGISFSRESNKIGYLFQDIGLFDSMTLWENVAFYHMYHLALKAKFARDMAIEKLAYVGIKEESANLYTSEISGGMKKRVGIARALACDAKIILFDEPTAGLDPIMSSVIDELISSCSREFGITVVMVTHDIKSTTSIADRIGLLYNGEFVWIGNKDEFASTKNEMIRQFASGSQSGPLKFI